MSLVCVSKGQVFSYTYGCLHAPLDARDLTCFSLRAAPSAPLARSPDDALALFCSLLHAACPLLDACYLCCFSFHAACLLLCVILLHSYALFSLLLARFPASACLQITDEMVPTDRLALQVLAQEMRDWPRLRVSGG